MSKVVQKVRTMRTPEAAQAAFVDLFAPTLVVRQATLSLVTYAVRDLLANPPPVPIEIIHGLLPAGLSLLASAPKVGKSWMEYQYFIAVATGGEVLGRRAEKGDALYLALEDGPYRAWSRIDRLLRRTTGRTQLPSDAAALDVAFEARLGDEMVEQVENWLAAHPHARAVLIDTLQRIRPHSSGRRNQYELDVEDVGRVLGITKRHPMIAVQVVHHDTKASHAPGADFVDAISGTSGIGGTSDMTSVLRRKRHETTGTLELTGKDVREELLHLAYDEDDPFWSLDPLGGITEEQHEAYVWLGANGPAGAKAVADGLARERSATQKLLDRMVEAEYLVKSKGVFNVPFKVSKVLNKKSHSHHLRH